MSGDFIGYWEEPGVTENDLWQVPVNWANGVGPAVGTVATWAGLITSKFATKPKFMNMVAATVQPLADLVTQLSKIPSLFDLDTAVGQQLDWVGEWIGVTRFIQTPLVGVYFAFDTSGVGFDQGSWFGPYNPSTGVTQLDDNTYRLLLYAKIAANHWDGTVPSAYAAWADLFPASAFTVLIEDLGGMHMQYALLGSLPDALTLALFTGGYLALKPSGVQIDAYLVPSVPSAPYFGFDAQNTAVAGFDTGAWGTVYEGA
jgi:hypothetical protein